MSLKVLNSELDDSINHIHDDGSEFRLVPRSDHSTVYLSSHVGCNLGCKMCWLTATNQVKMKALSAREMLDRVLPLLRGARGRVNFAFMARGDALANENVDGRLVRDLIHMADVHEHSKVTLSTIFPRKYVDHDVSTFLRRRFGGFQPTIYWSLYTADPVGTPGRDYWLPEALAPGLVAAGLADLQRATMQEVVVHHCLIKGFNDAPEQAHRIGEMLTEKYNLRYRVNLVRYNPPPGADTVEADEETYRLHEHIYDKYTGGRAKVQGRVGPDVYASCGKFVPDYGRGLKDYGADLD